MNAFFESYGFIHVHIVIQNDEEMIVQNDSIGGHINIITGKYAGFFVPPPLPSYCYMYFGTELGFVWISWRLILDRVITREGRVKKGCQGRDLHGLRVVSLYYQMCA
jgi:hypothetical protein